MNIDDINLNLLSILLQKQTQLLEQTRFKCQSIYEIVNTQILNIKVLHSQLEYNLQNDSQIDIKVESEVPPLNLMRKVELKHDIRQLKTQLKMYKRFHNFSEQDLENQIREINEFYFGNFQNGSQDKFDNEQCQKKESQIVEQFNNNHNEIGDHIYTGKFYLDQNTFSIFTQKNPNIIMQQQQKNQNPHKKQIGLLKKIQKKQKKKQEIKIQSENKKKTENSLANDEFKLQNNDSCFLKNQQLKTDPQKNQFLEKKSTYQRPKIIRPEQCEFCEKSFQTLMLLLCHEIQKHGIIRNSSHIIDPNYLLRKKEWQSQQQEKQKLEIKNKKKRNKLVSKNKKVLQSNIENFIFEQDLYTDNRSDQNQNEQAIPIYGIDIINNSQLEIDRFNNIQNNDNDYQQDKL